MKKDDDERPVRDFMVLSGYRVTDAIEAYRRTMRIWAWSDQEETADDVAISEEGLTAGRRHAEQIGAKKRQDMSER